MRSWFSQGMPLSDRQRWLLAGWSLFLVAGFALAAWLQPDPRGFGTHQQLGFPPCSFRLIFGQICPTCGGTTCFALFVRGEWQAALRANPAIFLFAMSCALQIPWAWLSVMARRTIGVNDPASTVAGGLLIICSLALIQWGWRIYWP
jgi:hypothetical protein